MAFQLHQVRKQIGLCILFLTIYYPTQAQTKGSFVDVRDDQTYETVTYAITGSKKVISDLDEYQTYLEKEPVSYEISLTDSMPSSMTWMAQSLSFEMEESKCKYDSGENCKLYGRLYTWKAAQNACPDGWHLPSDDEWYLLAYFYGGVSSAGEHLKSTELNGTNKSLFNVKRPSIFWSSSELDADAALDWKVNFRWVKLQRWKGGKKAYNSVRCVKDY